MRIPARSGRVPTWLFIAAWMLVIVGAPSTIAWTGYFAATAEPVLAAPAASSDPLELDIPSLGLQDVGILPMAPADGVLDPPDNPRLVGWWNASADAGAETGATLLTSHKVASGSGVFEHLVDIEPGAEIVVKVDTGSFSYVIQEVRILHKDQLAAEASRLFAQDGPHRLVLVTCEDWDGNDFQSNSVVVATPRPDPVTGGA